MRKNFNKGKITINERTIINERIKIPITINEKMTIIARIAINEIKILNEE